MLICRIVVDGEGKFTADSDETVKDVHAWDRVWLTNAEIVAAGVANWFGENISLFVSHKYKRCK